MNGKGGCCIARYTGSGAYDMSKVGRIMMRFRPIAPKPASANGSVSCGGSSSTTENTDPSIKNGRRKRRHAKETSGANNPNKRVCNRKRKASPESTTSGASASGVTAITLPLFPQTSNVKDSKKRGSPSGSLWLSFGCEEKEDPVMAATVIPPTPPRAVVGSWVTVECVTDTMVDCYRLGRTDEERVMNLQRDACPGFISDGLNRVIWTNGAYRKMVGVAEEELVAWLMIKAEVVVPAVVPFFTCRIRVVTSGKDKISLTLPCDVWRMDRRGFAWRLDTTAALSLGR